MSRRPKVRRHRNRCWMCKADKLYGRLTRREEKAELGAMEQYREAKWR